LLIEPVASAAPHPALSPEGRGNWFLGALFPEGRGNWLGGEGTEGRRTIIILVSSDTMALLVAVLIVGAIVVVAILKRPKRVKTSQDVQERRMAEATRRGWRLEVAGNEDEPACVYSGTTDFIPWRCEMRARDVVRGTDDAAQQVAHTRWSTDAARLADGLLLITPVAGGNELMPAAMPPELLARMAPLMELLGVDPRDAALVGSATLVEDPELNAHYRMRATEPATARKFLDGGGRAALLEAASWLARPPHPLLVSTLSRRGLTIMLQGWVEDLDVVERVARMGSRLAGVQGQ
jgi:hypothetical protein